MGQNLDGDINWHTLSVLIFACIYFRELKKIVLREYLFLRLAASFLKFRVYKFQPQRKKIRQLNQGTFGFLSRSTQQKDRQVTMEKLLLLILKKAELTKLFCAYFFSCKYYFREYEFCVYLACIYFRKCRLKENFAYLILQNRPKFAKFAKICTREENSTLKVHS